MASSDTRSKTNTGKKSTGKTSTNRHRSVKSASTRSGGKKKKAGRYQINAVKMIRAMLIACIAVVIIINLVSVIFNKKDKGDPQKIAIAMVSCAENSTFDYTKTYGFIEDIGDGAGYTGGIIGFTTSTGDMLHVVREYCEKKNSASLNKYIPSLEKVVGTDSKKGLGKGYIDAWKKAAKDPAMRKIQNSYRDRLFLKPAFNRGEEDGLSTLGKYIYYDTAVQHGPEGEGSSLMNIRNKAAKKVKVPSEGGEEAAFLNEFLKIRERSLKSFDSELDTSRVKVQKKLVKDEEFDMLLPLEFTMYGHDFELKKSDLI